MTQGDVIGILVLLAGTIVVGYTGQVVFRRTGISDSIWLVLAGVVVGPVLGVVDDEAFRAVLPFLSTFALLFLLFDSGLGMDVRTVSAGLARTLALAVLGFAFSTAAVIGLYALIGRDPLDAVLFGAIVAGTSSIAVPALTERMALGDKARNLLLLESVASDPLVIVLPLTLAGLLGSTAAGPSETLTFEIGSLREPLKEVLAAFSIGAVTGLIGALVWSALLVRSRGDRLDYVLTLAALLIVFVVADIGGGSGPIAALAFGIVLANARRFNRVIEAEGVDLKDTTVRAFHGELAFFIRSFFFVYLGIIVRLSAESLLIGGAVVLVLLVARLPAAYLGTLGLGLQRREAWAVRCTLPRGLAAAVVANVLVHRGVPGAEEMTDLALVVIVGSTLLSTLTATWIGRSAREPPEPVAAG